MASLNNREGPESLMPPIYCFPNVRSRLSPLAESGFPHHSFCRFWILQRKLVHPARNRCLAHENYPLWILRHRFAHLDRRMYPTHYVAYWLSSYYASWLHQLHLTWMPPDWVIGYVSRWYRRLNDLGRRTGGENAALKWEIYGLLIKQSFWGVSDENRWNLPL